MFNRPLHQNRLKTTAIVAKKGSIATFFLDQKIKMDSSLVQAIMRMQDQANPVKVLVESANLGISTPIF